MTEARFLKVSIGITLETLITYERRFFKIEINCFELVSGIPIKSKL